MTTDKVRVPRDDDVYDRSTQSAFTLVAHHANEAERYLLGANTYPTQPGYLEKAQVHATMALFYQGELKR